MLDNELGYIKTRVKFTRFGNVKYISHLDQNRMMQRAFNRSNLPIWRTQGFNPHMQLTFALPLSVGFISDCEYMDFRLTEDVDAALVVDTLNRALPTGFRALRAYELERKFSDIAFAQYEIIIDDNRLTLGCVEEAFESETLEVMKKSKSGVRLTDIKPMIKSIEITACCGEITLNAICSASPLEYLNPDYLVKVIEAASEIEEGVQFKEIRRINVFDKDLKEFMQ